MGKRSSGKNGICFLYQASATILEGRTDAAQKLAWICSFAYQISFFAEQFASLGMCEKRNRRLQVTFPNRYQNRPIIRLYA